MSTYKSGFILHRNRKIPVIWGGEHAQHIAEEHIKDRGSHPLLHVKIQQLAKQVEKWNKAKLNSKRFKGNVIDADSKKEFLVVVEIWSKFAYIITCYRI